MSGLGSLEVNFASPPNDQFHKAGIYKPLQQERKEVRLLRVLPGTGDSQVECEVVQNVSLTDCRRQATALRQLAGEVRRDRLVDEVAGQMPPGHAYCALSYAAGDLADTVPILLHGIQFNVFATLASALRKQRGSTLTSQWWVDQTCISQADSAEREDQVALMGEIYNSAYVVFVWLGNVGGAGQATAQWAKGVIDCYRRARDHIGFSSQSFDDDIIASAPAVVGYINDQPTLDLSLCLAWTQAEWFRRLWVIQEIALADFVLFKWESDTEVSNVLSREDVCIVCCRLQAVSALSLLRYGETWLRPEQVRVLRTAISTAENTIRFVQHFRGQLSDGLQWENALRFSRRQRCSDPRDHVYAMLNLIDQTQHDRMKADYTCSTNVTFARSVQAATKQQGTLDILAYAAPASSGPTLGLASWVPDYDKAPTTRHVLPPSGGNRRLHEALLIREPEYAPVFEIDNSGACAAILHCSIVSMGNVSTVSGMSNIVDQHDGYSTGYGPLEFVRPGLFQEWEDCLRCNRTVLPEFYDGLFQDLLLIGGARTSSTGSWRICFAPGGRACLVPASTIHDDQLVLLLDSNLPFIIRRFDNKKQTAGESFTLVGPAYVHGLDVIDTLRKAHEGKLDNVHRITLH